MEENYKKVCVDCHKELPDDAQFCPYCGSHSIIMISNFQNKRICPDCGNELEQNAKFCSFCGEKIEERKQDMKTKICPYCGETILAVAIKCRYCGADLNKNYTTHTQRKYNFSVFWSLIPLIGLVILVYNFANMKSSEDWLFKRCTAGPEKVAPNMGGFYMEYTCNNRPYTTVIKGSKINLNYNPAYIVYEGGNAIAAMDYEYNSRSYYCEYSWNRNRVHCDMNEFVSTLQDHYGYR